MGAKKGLEKVGCWGGVGATRSVQPAGGVVCGSLNLTLDVSQLSWWGEGIQWPWRCPVAKEC